jgi:hypothetical protein
LSLARKVKPAEATMLQMINKPLQEKAVFKQIIRKFDPLVPGLVFWPVIFGFVLLFGSLAVTTR